MTVADDVRDDEGGEAPCFAHLLDEQHEPDEARERRHPKDATADPPPA